MSATFTIEERGDDIVLVAVHATPDTTHIKIPDDVTVIGTQALWPCRHFLRSITIPPGVKIIGERACSECTLLERIEMGDGVETIEVSAFHGCFSLDYVVIPPSVTKIGYSAFRSCHNLQFIEIPDGVTEIRPNALADCEDLQYVVAHDGLDLSNAGIDYQRTTVYRTSQVAQYLNLLISKDRIARDIRAHNKAHPVLDESDADTPPTMAQFWESRSPLTEQARQAPLFSDDTGRLGQVQHGHDDEQINPEHIQDLRAKKIKNMVFAYISEARRFCHLWVCLANTCRKLHILLWKMMINAIEGIPNALLDDLGLQPPTTQNITDDLRSSETQQSIMNYPLALSLMHAANNLLIHKPDEQLLTELSQRNQANNNSLAPRHGCQTRRWWLRNGGGGGGGGGGRWPVGGGGGPL